MACVDPTVLSPCLGTKEDYNGSQTLQKIAKQLQLYKPPELDDNNDHQNCNERGTNCRGHDSTIRGNERFSNGFWRDRRAAVLICLFEGLKGELRVILTKRSMKLSSYPGDVALPGGKMDEKDVDDSATALREAMEEIGLPPSLVQVVANLEPFNIPLHDYLFKVIPVIGLLGRIEDFKPTLNTDEVDIIFDVPLEMFLKKDNHRFDEREWMGLKYVVHNFEFASLDHQGFFVIKGLTASILVRLLLLSTKNLHASNNTLFQTFNNYKKHCVISHDMSVISKKYELMMLQSVISVSPY